MIDRDNMLLRAITNNKVLEFYNRDNILVKNNALRVLKILNKDYLFEEVERLLNAY